MKLNISDDSGLAFDLPVLLRTRLLIQANSGGGKSWLLRRIAEQAFGKVQVIIIDPEGEFSTLREKFDYVLVGKGGETPADCRSAGMVAHKLLELNASAVCDLYEMKPQDRHQWVKLFIDALIDAPKKLWHPVIIFVDEAHVFCPESKAGESVASGSMINLATRGRKRGYCPIFATQRLGKLKKDAAAELTNVMIGQTFIDIDRDRAAECLGISRQERHQFDDEIKTIEPGNFFALGRAICTNRTLIKVGEVQTTHPEIGGRKFSAEPPPPSAKVKLMMPKLADLPKAAEEKAKTETELRGEIRQLRVDLAEAKRSHVGTKVEKVEVPALTVKERKKLTQLQEMLTRLGCGIEGARENLEYHQKKYDEIKPGIEFIRKLLSDGKLLSPPLRTAVIPRSNEPVVPAKNRTVTPLLNHALDSAGYGVNDKLPHGEEKVLTACLQFEVGLKREQITVLTGFKRSTRDAYIYRLTQKQLVVQRGEVVVATEAGKHALPHFKPLPVGDELQDHWRKTLPAGERQLFEHIIAAYPESISRDRLSELTGFKRSTRDAYLYRMSNKMLFSENTSGSVRASENLF